MVLPSPGREDGTFLTQFCVIFAYTTFGIFLLNLFIAVHGNAFEAAEDVDSVIHPSLEGLPMRAFQIPLLRVLVKHTSFGGLCCQLRLVREPGDSSLRLVGCAEVV
eukprot:3317876-Amphidinium_carterae.1